MARPELSSRLDEADYRLALVAAPAGYGKTATLSSWAREQPAGVAWLSCDAADAEPSRFMAGLLSSLTVRWPGIADDAFVLLDRNGAHLRDAAVSVANELAAIPDPGVIVVDDVHLATPAPEVVTTLVEALPPHFRLVLGSRSDLPVSTARLRVHGRLLELRSDDLRFTASQTAEFARLHGLSLEPSDVGELHNLTEGWPAGAQLAALALQRGADRRQLFEAFARTDRAVADFLLSEVLDNLEPDLVNFLVDTSVLDAFDAGLCASVSGREDAALVLDHLISTGLFVVPLDDERRWNRYHHLFGAFLRARLASLGEERRRSAHERASHALEARGDVTGALRQAMTVGDVDRVGRVLRGAIDRNKSMSDAEVAGAAIRSWLHEFGPVQIEQNPEWVVEMLIALISIAGPDDAAWWLNRVQQAHAEAGAELRTLIEAAWCELHLHNGEAADATTHATAVIAALDGQPPNRGLFPLIYVPLIRASIQAGELDAARAAVQRAAALTTGSAVADEVRIPAWSAFVAAADGELQHAEQLAAAVERRADDLHLGIGEVGRIMADLARADAHLERNELEAAATLVESARVKADASHRAPFQSLVAIHEARVARASGDQAAAEDLLLKAELLLAHPDEAARRVFVEERAHQVLRFEPARAGDVIGELDPSRVETRILDARRLLLGGSPCAAAAVLEPLPAPSSRRLRVERSILWALVWHDRDLETANDHLRAALVESRPERLIRSIIDPGVDVHKLLASYPRVSSTAPFVDELLGASGQAVWPRRRNTVSNTVEPLTAREVTVLRYLCSHLTYAEIAAALYVSLNTLKSHVKSVYRKLDVASRTDAVTVGRELRVI